ncbi:zinc-binding dehydrogenase [Chloroflexota bacterium]
MAGVKGKAMVNFGPGIPWEMKEYPVPDPEPDAIVTKITMSSLCGSDVHEYQGEFLAHGKVAEKERPRISGHEFVGKVYKLGSNVKTDTTGQPLKEGDRVVWCYYVNCGRCPACINEIATCPNRHAHAGTSSDDFPHFKGAFAEYYYVSPGQWIYKVPDTLPDEAVVYVDCAASTVAYGLDKVRFPLGGKAVIQGAGGLGLAATPMVKDMGASQVIVIDKIPERLKLTESFGADHTINSDEYPTAKARIKRVKELTGWRGVDVVVEVVASSPEVVPEGLEMLALRGTYLTIGLVGPFTTTIGMGLFIGKGIRLIGSANYKAWTIPKVMEFMARTKDKYPFDKIISHKFKLEDVEEAFRQHIAGKVVRAAIIPD